MYCSMALNLMELSKVCTNCSSSNQNLSDPKSFSSWTKRKTTMEVCGMGEVLSGFPNSTSKTLFSFAYLRMQNWYLEVQVLMKFSSLYSS